MNASPGTDTTQSAALEAAAELFKSRGFTQVGLADVARLAAIEVDALRAHYPDTETLGAAWLGRMHNLSGERHEAMRTGSEDAEEVLRAYFADLIHYLERTGFAGCPFSNMGQQSGRQCVAINEEITQHKDFIRDFFRELCGRILGGHAEGDLMGDALFLIYSGATIESANRQSSEPAEQALRVFEATLSMWKSTSKPAPLRA